MTAVEMNNLLLQTYEDLQARYSYNICVLYFYNYVFCILKIDAFFILIIYINTRFIPPAFRDDIDGISNRNNGLGVEGEEGVGREGEEGEEDERGGEGKMNTQEGSSTQLPINMKGNQLKEFKIFQKKIEENKKNMPEVTYTSAVEMLGLSLSPSSMFYIFLINKFHQCFIFLE